MDTSPTTPLFSAKSNGKTYERNKLKYQKNTEGDGSLKNTQQKSFTATEQSLIAVEVAKLLNPTIENAIQSAIEKALGQLQNSIKSLNENLSSQNRQLLEIQNLVSDIQDDTISSSMRVGELEKKTRDLQSKVDDLENRTIRNNLRFIGIPESFKVNDLITLITVTIPTKLGIHQNLTNMRLERVHRIGPLNEKLSTKPRAVIAKFLDYS
ncbi:hypothetical protein XELAEV_18012232mg [Xenopus laevis]|uniref:Uncharacterized protein n=1 Tax=Xenopus laevis TaxID=8355 RepID=A0A974DQ07_XENLA|nr:hypothetical protein XELAEV_18012232mg [Xenopus laevis]